MLPERSKKTRRFYDFVKPEDGIVSDDLISLRYNLLYFTVHVLPG